MQRLGGGKVSAAAGAQGLVQGRREAGGQILSRKGGRYPGGSGDRECGLDHKVRRPWWLSGPLAPKRQLPRALTSRFPFKKLTGAQSPRRHPQQRLPVFKVKV